MSDRNFRPSNSGRNGKAIPCTVNPENMFGMIRNLDGVLVKAQCASPNMKSELITDARGRLQTMQIYVENAVNHAQNGISESHVNPLATSDNAPCDGTNGDHKKGVGRSVAALDSFAYAASQHVGAASNLDEAAAIATACVSLMSVMFPDTSPDTRELYRDVIWSPVEETEEDSRQVLETLGLMF